MTAVNDAWEFKVEWLKDSNWQPYCQHCTHWEKTYCDNMESDHYYHILHPEHYACEHFEEN
jgi:hypothetical protein